MKNTAELMKKLKKDITRLNNKIEHRKIYNFRNCIIRCLIYEGIGFEYFLPFIMTGTICFNMVGKDNNVPFRVDKVTTHASVLTIDTSSGIHRERISFDVEYDDESIKYSTGWIINENNLYERTITSYRLSDEVDLTDIDSILSMTKDELESMLVITDIKTIQKSSLNPEDSLYNESAIIVTNHHESKEEILLRDETGTENFLLSLWYIFLTLLTGVATIIIKNKVFKISFTDKLRGYEQQFKYISEDELDKLREILKLKQNNLELLNEDNNHEGYSYRLRKG